MSPAPVTQLRAPRKATRLGPKEARRVCADLGSAAPQRGAARELLLVLLRSCDPRLGFAITVPRYDQPDPRDPDRLLAEGMTTQLGVTRWTLSRATTALERAGLVFVRRGLGRDWTVYVLRADVIAELLVSGGEDLPHPWQNYPVSPAEPSGRYRVQNAPPEGAERTRSGSKLPPQRVQNPVPYTRARDAARASDSRVTPDTPVPPIAGQVSGGSPPAPPSVRCEHGQTSCRRCGTSPRARAALDAAAVKAAELERRRAEDAARRQELAERRAAATRATPDGARRAREQLHRGDHQEDR